LEDIEENQPFRIALQENRLLQEKKEVDVVTKPHKMTEEEIAELTEKEEIVRDKKGQRHRTKERWDPVLKEKTKVKKFRPGSAFMKKSTLPLWTRSSSNSSILCSQ
jgi:hypothetical protein